MNHWCESCAKNLCYVVDNRPKCFVPITNTASGTPESYLAKSLRYSQDSHEIATDEPQTQLTAKCLNCHNAKACKENNWQGCRFEPIEDKPQIDDFFREPTAEERKAVADYIDSISVSTGVNVFDFMDESQTEQA